MSFLSDILNPTLLVFLAITMLIIALLIIYFEGKMREQNHKISSMLSLVSSLAEEVNVIKFHLNHMNIINNVGNNTGNNMNINDIQSQQPFYQNGGVNISLNSSSLENNLIPVSDDEGEEDDDDDEDDDDEDDEDDDDEDDEDDEDDDDEDDEEDDDDDNDEDDEIKVLNLDVVDTNKLFSYLETIELDKNNTNDDEATSNNDDDDDNVDDIEDIDYNQLTEDEKSIENVEQNLNTVELDFDTNLKSINISTLEEDKTLELIDYKKLSLNKLKSLVLDKGLATDVSKLKKNDLLKLIGIE